MIYVTLGTMFMDFGRLVRKMDEIAVATGEQVIIQTGLAATLPRHCEHFDFKPHADVLALQARARLVVAHAGIGVTMDALRCQRPLVLVPRLKRFREHMNDHQVEIAHAVEKRGWGRMALDIDDLDALCKTPPPQVMDYEPDRERLITFIRQYLEGLASGD
ncbi:MAG: hypothetical protein RLZZ303_2083 [Candidatus Hydrogenedentota bacterium]